MPTEQKRIEVIAQGSSSGSVSTDCCVGISSSFGFMLGVPNCYLRIAEFPLEPGFNYFGGAVNSKTSRLRVCEKMGFWGNGLDGKML